MGVQTRYFSWKFLGTHTNLKSTVEKKTKETEIQPDGELGLGVTANIVLRLARIIPKKKIVCTTIIITRVYLSWFI